MSGQDQTFSPNPSGSESVIIDMSKMDTLVSSGAGINPPRKDYRGSYYNVDHDNTNYRNALIPYKNSSMRKQPTMTETRPFEKIDYTLPSSNPFFKGLGELAGSDEFDVTDLTHVFGDDFEVELDREIHTESPIDINHNIYFGPEYYRGFGDNLLDKARAAAKKALDKARAAAKKTTKKVKDVAEKATGKEEPRKWWHVFPVTTGGILSKTPMGVFTQGAARIGNTLFLLGTLGLGLFLGAKGVTWISKSMKETSGAITSFRSIPPHREEVGMFQ